MKNNFETFIKENHPDPDFAMREYNQMCIMAEEYAQQRVNEVLDKAVKEISSDIDKLGEHEDMQDGLYSALITVSTLKNK